MQKTTLTRAFIARGRRGKRASGSIRLRQHYLRDDLEATALQLIASPRSGGEQLQLSWSASHFVIPDWVALMQYLELFDSPGMPTTDAIFLETALNVFRDRGTNRQRDKLQLLLEQSRLRCVFFNNEHCDETHVQQMAVGTAEAKEQPHTALKDERAAMAVVLAAVWYAGLVQRRAPQTAPTIVLLAACPELVEEAQEEEEEGEEEGSSTTKAPSASKLELRATLLQLAAEAGVQVLSMEQYLNCWCSDSHAEQLHLQRQSLRAAHLRRERMKAVEAATGTVNGYTAYTINSKEELLAANTNAASAGAGAGAGAGTVLSGRFEVSQYQPQEATVTVAQAHDSSRSGGVGGSGGGEMGSSRKVLIVGRPHMNRAVHGDDVIVQLLPEALWQAPSTRRRLTHAKQDAGEGADGTDAETGGAEGTKASARSAVSASVMMTGRVVGIEQRNWRPYISTLPPPPATAADASGRAATTTAAFAAAAAAAVIAGEAESNGDGDGEAEAEGEGGGKRGGGSAGAKEEAILATPMDVRIPRIRIRTRQAHALRGQRLVVRIDGWLVDSMYPHGHYERSVGAVGEMDAEVAALLVEHEATRPPFSASALACLPDMRKWAREAAKAENPGEGGDGGGGEGEGEEGEGEAGGDDSTAPTAALAEGEFPITDADLAQRRDMRPGSSTSGSSVATGTASTTSTTSSASPFALAGDAQRVFSVDPPGCQDIDLGDNRKGKESKPLNCCKFILALLLW
eukprot:g2813.t1